MSKHTLMTLFTHSARYMGPAHTGPMYHGIQPETKNEKRGYAFVNYPHDVSRRSLEKFSQNQQIMNISLENEKV